MNAAGAIALPEKLSESQRAALVELVVARRELVHRVVGLALPARVDEDNLLPGSNGELAAHRLRLE